ncbi:AAA family ATPase [Clostridium sp.]|uniref:AAA family ATPase n=1 Tax=Clostridium sp. TaxID=1506 RepID=UPI002FCBD055
MRDNILLVLIGVPASGKTTFAKEFIKDKSTWIRISREDIKLMCGNYWALSREALINSYEELMIEKALVNNYNVIIDSTNLNHKTKIKWEALAYKLNIKLQYKEFIIPYKEAIKRDKNRAIHVGEDNIRMLYRKYYPDILASELDEI